VSKQELRSNPEAEAAVVKEWNALRNAGCWDETKVREWSDVAHEARTKGIKTHVGRIFEICVEKNSELHPSNPARKFQGRVVCQGNQVKDENWDVALFQELGTAPATLVAGKACDAYGLQPGYDVQQADAEQAYIQSRLGGDIPTFVRLPAERRPASWSKYRDPVCPLILALYGHPDAGGYWEQHCHKHLTDVGLQIVSDWRSCYVHPKLRLFLVVYVDDFKLSGPCENLDKGGAMFRQKERKENPTPLNKYLGCSHYVHEVTLDYTNPDHARYVWPIPKSVIVDAPRGGDADVALAATGTPVQHAGVAARTLAHLPGETIGTPMSNDDQHLQSNICVRSDNEYLAHASAKTRKVRCIIYDMSEFLQSWLKDTSNSPKKDVKSLRKVATPFIEIATTEGEDDPKGELQPIAARVLMKILYAARMARYDLLRPTCYLATKITKWSKRCDRALHKLVSYINSSLNLKMTSWIGDPMQKWELVVYSDADLAGDLETSRSTSGVFVCMRAPNTMAILQGISKRQSCVSHSTPEAELVAADFAIRTEALPALQLWEKLKGVPMEAMFMEDNTAAIKGLTTGKNPSMRHMSRTHRIDMAFVHETVVNKHVKVVHCPTDMMCADIFTKHYTRVAKWQPVVANIAHVDPSKFWKLEQRAHVAVEGTPSPRDCVDVHEIECMKQVEGTPLPDVVSVPSSVKHDRTLVEFCRGSDSLL